MDMADMSVCATGDFARCVGAPVYYIDPEGEECKIAYPNLLFDHGIVDGRGMVCSVLTLNIDDNRGMGDVENGETYDVYFPPGFLRLFDGPSCDVVSMMAWRLHHRSPHGVRASAGVLHRPGERGVQHPHGPALRPRHHRQYGMMCSALTLAIGTAGAWATSGRQGLRHLLRRSSCALRCSVLQHHGHDERGRLHHR